MSTKNSSENNTGIVWPKTPQRQALEQQARQEQTEQMLEGVAAVGQLMVAASAVPQQRQKKLIHDALQAANSANTISMPNVKTHGGKKQNGGKKRPWKAHADHYFENNKAWDEVTSIRIQCADLLRTAMALTPLLKSHELLYKVANKRLLNRNIQAIIRDTTTLSEVLGKIIKLHSDRSGGAVDEVDLAKSCTVYSEYVDFAERYDAALMPIVVHTSEMLQEALWALHKVNPTLANELNTRMMTILKNIQSIIHETTGADSTVSPGAVAELEQEAVTEQVAA
jgi:hypothetical protein